MKFIAIICSIFNICERNDMLEKENNKYVYTNISVKSAYKMLKSHSDILLLDVRSDYEYSVSHLYDALHFYSVFEEKIVKTYENHDLVFISSPKFSADGNRIVFNAVDRKGYSDIYIYDLVEDELFRITNDYYNDKDPCFGLTDQQVIFSSDRTGGEFSGKNNLFSINLNNYEIN